MSSTDRALERTRPPSPRPEVAVAPTSAPAVVVTPVAFTGVPTNLLDAYRSAEALLARTQPGCGLRWYHLAGIGRIESGHARGGQAGASGDTVPHILGPALSGGPFAAISDSDHGALDGDLSWDRAVGPMQFIPTTWAFYRTDGNADGISNPHNIYDAAAAAGRYLCSGGLNLANPADLDAAVFRYNHSREYVAAVLTWMHLYSSGATPMPAAGPSSDPGPTTAVALAATPPPPPPDVDPVPLPEPIPDPKPPVAEPTPPVEPAPLPEPTPEPLPCTDLLEDLPILGSTDLLCVDPPEAAPDAPAHLVRPDRRTPTLREILTR
ncbi:lytic transglycosylase domain-containing protein [Actinokineospora sp. HUAS TT18]|uniref:lytic transglycosylase domain-containing protein n=1 Tax=Actinokineospora sp. HUAS TT18 TaxID=3447451 RepID=UPI003F522E23